MPCRNFPSHAQRRFGLRSSPFSPLPDRGRVFPAPCPLTKSCPTDENPMVFWNTTATLKRQNAM
jgi:hypothetical protein